MAKIKLGDEITAVYFNRGTRYVRLLRVTKVGRKYLHGVTLSPDPEGHLREFSTTRVNLEESTIYPGLRQDLREAEFKYRDDYKKWQHQKQDKKNDLNWELRNLVESGLKEWEQEHPMPQPPEFPTVQEVRR